jgi:hypothetical protein
LSHRDERRTNQALRRRIDDLLGRVAHAREEIVERGLDAVHPGLDSDRDDDAVAPDDSGLSSGESRP